MQQMMRAIAIPDMEIPIRRECDVRRDKINCAFGISGILARIAVCPQNLALRRGLHDLALIDVAMIENFLALLASNAESMRAAAKFLAECANVTPRGIVDDHGLPAHAGFIYRVGDVDLALFVLRQTMGVSP